MVESVDLQMVWKSETETIVSGSFDLIRPECSFRKINIKLVGDTRDVDVPMQFLDGAKIRSGGPNAFGPWLIGASVARLRATSVWTVRHKCPGVPWMVVTRFYP
ncbi:hypothetical protein [Pseudooceanicola sp. MF1-13]|uniref:hypothetical protein n=1 Tax=Pseudooceanicola sp. MF1-13 TaxID=3379095 RepID=UPI0038913DC4